MKQWPTDITPAILDKNSATSDAEVAQDIADTEAEISHLTKVLTAYHLLARHELGEADRKLAAFRAQATAATLADRRAFVQFLRALQAARAAH